jgi:putative membrane protein
VIEPVFQKIHPLTIVVNLERAVRRLALLIVVVLINMFTGQGVDQFEIIGGALGGLIVFEALIRWLTFGYAIHGGQLIIKQGVLNRTRRTIPLDRIQNINLRRSLTHRLTGLVDLEIETAAGAQAEASISALDAASAEALRRQLLSSGPSAVVESAAFAPEPVLYQARLKDLLIAGATENRWPAVIGLAVAAGAFGNFAANGLRPLIRQILGRPEASGPAGPAPWLIAVFGILILGWLISIFGTIATYYGFEIRRREGRLIRSYGLFSTTENVVLLRRVQLLVIRQSLLQRLLGWCRIYLETAGGFGGKQEGSEVKSGGTSLISPLSRIEEAAALGSTALAMPLDMDSGRRISPRSLIRRLRLAGFTALILAGAGAAAVLILRNAAPESFFGRPLAMLLSLAGPAGIGTAMALTGWLDVRSTRWMDQGGVFSVRTGALGRTAWHVPTAKIQTISLNESPGQRRLSLLSLHVSTAASSGIGGQEVVVPDLDAEEARALAASLHARAKAGARENPDGF